jgi:hypothetical protein
MPNCIKIGKLKGRTRNTAQFPCFRKSIYKYVNMSLSRFSDWLKRSSTNEAHNIYGSVLLTHFWVSKIWRAASMTSRPSLAACVSFEADLWQVYVLCRYIIKTTGIFLYVLISVQCFRFFKPVFHFNRIVPKCSVFLCFLSGSVKLITSTQNKMLWFVTIRWSRKQT